MCSEKMVKDDVNLKFDDIDATSNGDPNLVACEIDNGMLAEHDIEIGDDCLKENVDRDKGNLQTKPFSPGNSHINNDVIGSEKNVNKSKTKRQGRGTGRTTPRHTNPSPAVLEGFMCSEKMVKDDVNLKFDDIDATSNGNPNLVACEIDNGMLAEHDIEIGDDCLKKNVDRDKGSLQTKPFSPGNSHINNDVIRSEKNVNKSETKRQGRGTRRTITRHTNPSPAVLEGLMCSEKMVKDDVNLKFDDIDATSNVDPNLVACEIDNRMLAEHDIEIGDDCLKENVDRDKGSLQTKPFSPGNSHINNDVIRSEKNVNKSKTKRQGRGTGRTTTRHTNPSPAVLEGLMCSEKMVKDDVNLKFDDIDATSNGDPYLVACEIDNGMLAEHDIEIGDDCLMENVDRDKGSLQTKPFSPGNSHINNDVIRSEKNVHKSKIKRQGRGTRRTTTRHTNPSPAVLEGLMCSEKMVKDDVNLKFDNIDATSNGDSNLVACGIDNGMLAEHGIEIGDDCLKENVDRDKGSLQTPKHGTLRTTGTPTGKRQYSNTLIPPALPRRVQITPDEVSKAFGLKTSRSGRLLVPPLAHWCNQTIAYDLDGGIIAIFNGISEDKKHNGGHTFRPPTEAEAIKMQRKLCKAANEVIKTPKSGKKMSKG